MSATGSEALRSRAGLDRVRRITVAQTGGFTLVELIVALAIVGLALTVVPVSLAKLHAAMQYRSAVGELVAGLKTARNDAARSGASVPFTVDVANRRIDIGGARSFVLPGSLEVGLIVAEREIDRQVGSIRFYPDGSSTGGSILLRRPSGDGVRLRVDWLFGRVSQEPLG